jgi:hypothetical protein
MRRSFVLTVTLLVAVTMHADDQREILRWNVAIQPLMTLASAAVQGKLRTWDDWKRCLRIGATTGAAFYGSKRLVADGRVIEGLALANVASSMTSNAAAGRHALSRIGVTFGPVRAELSTPKDKERPARVHLSTSISELVSFGMMWERSDDITIRDGLISFRRDTDYPDFRDENLTFPGYTIGVFPGTSPAASETVWRHEVVHVIQVMQVDALEPGWCEWGRLDCRKKPASDRWFEIEPLRIGIFPGANAGAMTFFLDYDQRWTEVEAYRLAQNCKLVNLGCQAVRPPRR